MLWGAAADDQPVHTISPESRQESRRKAGFSALGKQHRDLLNAVAAIHLRYAQPHEALALLQLTAHIWPGDAQTLRLFVQGLLDTGKLEAADQAILAYEQALRPARPTRTDMLRKAALDLARGRLREAHAIFAAFWSNRTPTPVDIAS